MRTTLVAYAPMIDAALVEILVRNGIDAEAVSIERLPRSVRRPDVAACVLALETVEDEIRIHAIRNASRTCAILAVMRADSDALSPRDKTLILSAVRAGVDGIAFSRKPSDVLEPLRAVLRGEVALPRAVAGLLAQSLIGYGFGKRYTELRLTRSEAMVCNLLANGLSTAEIATRLHLAPGTVRRHISSAAKKADASTREELLTALLERPASAA